MKQKKSYLRAVMGLFLILIFSGCGAKENAQSETEAQVQPETEQTQIEAEVQTEPEAQVQTETAGTEEAAAKENVGEQGFATSEEAVLSYLAGLRDNDFGRMEDCFFDKSGAVDIAAQYAYLCGIDLIPELVSEGYVKLSEDGDAKKFVGQLTETIEGTDIAGMTFLGFVSFDLLFANDESTGAAYQRMLDMVAGNNGGTEVQSQVACIQLNDAKCMVFFDTMKVDDRWYILQLGGCFPQFAGAEEDEKLMVRLDAAGEDVMELILAGGTEIPKLPETRTDAAKRERTESEGYDTPEDAVTAYLEGLRACDTEKMLSTFAVESYAENYDMQAYLEYMQTYMFLEQEISLPPVNDFIAAMISSDRKEQLKEEALSQGNALYLWDCYYHDTEPEQDALFEWEELQEMLDLGSIEVVEFVLPETIAEKSASEQVDALRAQRCGICGADQQQDCVVIFTCGGEKYCLFMEEVQYNGRWYNKEFGNFAYSAIGGYSDMKGTLPYEALEYMQENE